MQVQWITDPETNCDITIRSDKTMIVHFENSNLVLHSDGTRILRTLDNSLTIIEKEQYPTVSI